MGIVKDTADALAYLHLTKHYVHRDIKNKNILNAHTRPARVPGSHHVTRCTR